MRLCSPVTDSAVIGVLTGFKRKGKDYSVQDPMYRRYVRIWCAIYPVRAVAVYFIRTAKAAAKKLGFRRIDFRKND